MFLPNTLSDIVQKKMSVGYWRRVLISQQIGKIEVYGREGGDCPFKDSLSFVGAIGTPKEGCGVSLDVVANTVSP